MFPTCICILFWLAWVANHNLNAAEAHDLLNETAADYAVMIQGLPADAVQSDLVEFFNDPFFDMLGNTLMPPMPPKVFYDEIAVDAQGDGTIDTEFGGHQKFTRHPIAFVAHDVEELTLSHKAYSRAKVNVGQLEATMESLKDAIDQLEHDEVHHGGKERKKELQKEQVKMSEALEVQGKLAAEAQERYETAETEYKNSANICTGIGFLVFEPAVSSDDAYPSPAARARSVCTSSPRFASCTRTT